MTPSIAIVGGGTGGHIYPLIALHQHRPQVSLLPFCSVDRQDRQIFQAYGFDAIPLPTSRRLNWEWVRAYRIAMTMFTTRSVGALIASGGYGTIPVLLAAKRLGIPIILLEQNAIPGRVNRLFHRFADRVCLAYEESQSYFDKAKSILTGNPVRRQFLPDLPEIGRLISELSPPVWLIIGGSQGARGLNHTVLKNMQGLIDSGITIIHAMGRGDFVATYGDQVCHVDWNDRGGIYRIAVPYCEGLDRIYPIADLVIARAGATTISELAVWRKPAILVPFPLAKDDHQTANATVAMNQGWALRWPETNWDTDRLIQDATLLKASATGWPAIHETAAESVWSVVDAVRR